MATEIWHEFDYDAPVTLIPVADGRLEVWANEDKIFDRKAEGGAYPEMERVRQIKQQIKQKLQTLSAAR
jgi:predicted Rdx family selenoprotein